MAGVRAGDTDALVVGAGLAGLFVAAELRRRRLDVVLVEAGEVPGGVARTVREGGFTLEPGVGSLPHAHPALDPILSSAGVDLPEPVSGLGRRFLFDGSRLVAAPSPRMLRRSILPARTLPRLMVEPLVRARRGGDEETLASFMRRRLGTTAGGLVAGVMAGGVFAGDPDRLSASAAFPELVGMEARFGSLARGALRLRRSSGPRRRTAIPDAGMDGVADALAGAPGTAFLPGFPVSTVQRLDGGLWRVEGPTPITAKRVVVASSPEASAGMVPGSVGRLLAGIRCSPVAVTWLGGPEPRMRIPDGYGYLSTPRSNTVAIGCLFESSAAPSRAPAGHSLVKVISGGDRRPEVLEWDDERLVDEVAGEVSRALGTEVAPTFTKVVRHLPGIPQYELGHRSRLHRIDEALAALPGLDLAGWSYRGVGVAHLAVDAVRLADRLTENDTP